MRDKRLQIFVSSTFTDLIEERQAAVEAILSSGHIPAGMELFAAGDESQMSVIERWIDESDIYLLIMGGRYGSIEQKSQKSYTQLEFEYAIKMKKPLFAVVMNESALELKVKERGISVIEQISPKELKAFKEDVLKNLVRFWDDKKDIKIAIHETLSDMSYNRKELVGWIRGDQSVNSSLLAEEIARLTKENSDLSKQLLATPSQNQLFGGLTFEELKNLLQSHQTSIGRRGSTKEISLYDLLMLKGESLSKNYRFSDDLAAIEDLSIYKLVKVQRIDSSTANCSFSEEGHNFYLRARYGGVVNPSQNN